MIQIDKKVLAGLVADLKLSNQSLRMADDFSLSASKLNKIHGARYRIITAIDYLQSLLDNSEEE